MKNFFALCMIAVAVSAASKTKVDKSNNGKAGKEQGTVAPVDFTLQREPSTLARNAKFARFAAKEGKNYISKAEFKERKAIFEATDKEIARLNKKAGKNAFGHNKFSDLTDAEKKALIPEFPESDLKGSKFDEYLENAKGRHLQTVQDVDWSTPVRDQGSCGSCVAFAVSTVLEGARVAQGVTDVNNTTATLGEISQQHLVSCGVANGYPSVYGCDGAWGYGYMQMLSQEGWLAEGDFPAYTSGDIYDTQAGLCSNYDATKAVLSVQDYNNDVQTAGYTLDMTKTNDIIARLQESPLYIAVDANQSAFMQYQSSDIVTSDMCGGSQLNHMVSLVGFTKGTTTQGEETTREVTTTYPAESVNPDYIDWNNYWIYCPSTHSDYITYNYVWWYGYYNFKCWRAEYTETTLVTTTSGEQVTPDYFTVQNSWGTGWGDNGFIKLAVEPGLGPCLMNYVTGWMDLVTQETNVAQP